MKVKRRWVTVKSSITDLSTVDTVVDVDEIVAIDAYRIWLRGGAVLDVGNTPDTVLWGIMSQIGADGA